MSETVQDTTASPQRVYPQLGPLALARPGIDRGCDRRLAEGMADRIWETPGTCALYLNGGRTLIRDGQLVLFESSRLPRPTLPVYLGRTLDAAAEPAGTDVVLAAGDDPPEEAQNDGAVWAGLRDVATELSARDSALFVEALAVANWHATHTHCPRCGAATNIEGGGWVRRCPRDNSEHFPRTDPAIIVSIVDEQDRLLLGNSASWAPTRFSTLAGFVEPGESLEAAVIREVAEEAGVVVHSPQYLGSQPWPFPRSLMLGFTARAADSTVRPDEVEIKALRWFTRAELAEEVGNGSVQIASGASIARSLIEHWYGGPIPGAREPHS